MYQGHPFRTGVRTLLESKPAVLRAPVVGVAIAIDRKNPRGTPKLPEIERVLGAIAAPEAVRLLEIEPSCLLDRVSCGVVLRAAELSVPRVGIEPTTRGFSILCSTN